MHFSRDKKKELAPNYAAYYPFGVDVYLSPQKLNHISRFVQLPDIQLSSKLPPLLVVNVQVSHKYKVKALFRAESFVYSTSVHKLLNLSKCLSVYLFISLHFFSSVLNLSNCYTCRHLSKWMLEVKMNCMPTCFKHIQLCTSCSRCLFLVPNKFNLVN